MTTDWSALAGRLAGIVGDLRPVAVAYLATPPSDATKFDGVRPSGCSFWSLAAKGSPFYTIPSDHFNCPIGSYTHAIDLPADRVGELEQTLSLMASIGYLRMEEVPAIPRLANSPAVVYYAPLAKTTVDPDVVIFTGRPGPLMRLQEAATRAGVASPLPMLGRPSCMALPASMTHGSVVSTGCIGNRVYTDLGDDELYLMIPGKQLCAVVEHARVVATANDTLAQYHQDRRRMLTA